MNKSENINELAAALSKAQAEIKGALKDSSNPFFKSKYADLDSVWEALRAPFTKNGLSVSQVPSETDKGTLLETIIMHSSGQWLSGNILVKAVKDDPQGKGSALTYYRRYALSAMAGVSQVDDDAESAMNRDIEINDVKKIEKKPPMAKSATAVQMCECGGMMMRSHYHQNELYCPKCKATKTLSA